MWGTKNFLTSSISPISCQFNLQAQEEISFYAILIKGKMMWDKFSNIMANEMHFEMDQHINVIDPDIFGCKDCSVSAWAVKKVVDLEHKEQQEGTRNEKGKQAICLLTDEFSTYATIILLEWILNVESKKEKDVLHNTNKHQIISEQEDAVMKNSKHGIQNTAVDRGKIQEYEAANVLVICKGEGNGMSNTEYELEQLDTLCYNSMPPLLYVPSSRLTNMAEYCQKPRVAWKLPDI
ncbi:hypothetical protein EV424DRAFT_1347022 [Suillus variegatus]|nr:hypothetical protein EV424DRAFT_1347022 [Suillus variegatus]